MKIAINISGLVLGVSTDANSSFSAVVDGQPLSVIELNDDQRHQYQQIAGFVHGIQFVDGRFSVIKPPPAAAIVEIENANPITHRALRELILTIGEIYPAGKNTVFYQRVLAAELAIQTERAKL